MGADYVAAVAVRYALYLGVCALAQFWELPESWAGPIAVGTLLYLVVVVQSWPAASYARRAAQPWLIRTFLTAASAHALGGSFVYALQFLTELRYHDPDAGSMRFEALWVNEPSLAEVGTWIAVYAIVSAVWAVLVGYAARRILGVEPAPDQLLRIRRRHAGITAE